MAQLRSSTDAVKNVTHKQQEVVLTQTEGTASSPTTRGNAHAASNIFQAVPNELWNQIATDMSLDDQASLAMTCRHTFVVFSPQLLALRLPEHRDDRLKLLFRIPKLFPAHYLCAECVRYHLKSTKYNEYESQELFLHQGRSPLTISEVAKALRKDEAWSLDDKTSRCDGDFSDWSVSVRIRQQQNIFRPHVFILLIYMLPITTSVQQEPSVRAFPTCQHLRNPQTLGSQLTKAINSTPRPWERGERCKYTGSLYRCPYCPSEYRISVHGSSRESQLEDGARYRLLISRYIDIGEGLSPHSEEWNALTRPRPAGVSALSPFDISDAETVAWRCCSVTGREPDVTTNMAVLPVPDD